LAKFIVTLEELEKMQDGVEVCCMGNDKSATNSESGVDRIGVLIVDDDPAIRDVVHYGMRRRGFTAWTADDGPGAVEWFRDHHEQIDMVLLDVRMPGLDGPATLAELQKVQPALRCCFMSGDLGGYSEAELLALGAEKVFHKPFLVSDVAESVVNLVGSAARCHAARCHVTGTYAEPMVRMLPSDSK
jgi:CheY-like chemotaxis protein